MLHGLALKSRVVKADRIIGNVFRIIVDGAPDALPDVEVVPRSVRIDKRSGTNSYYQVVLPYTDQLIDQLTARPNADVYIEVSPRYASAAPGVWVEHDWFHPNEARYDIGPERGTITLAGYRQSTNVAPVTETVTDADLTQFQKLATGAYVLSLATLNIGITAGDSLIYGAHTYLITAASWQADAGLQQFELTGERQ
jgi:hypothetical protein